MSAAASEDETVAKDAQLEGEETDQSILAAGEYPVNLNITCYESEKTGQFSDLFRVDLAKLSVEADGESGEKKYTLYLPIDYKSKGNYSGIPFGYSYSKYTAGDGISFADIQKQDGYIDLKAGITADELVKLDDASSKFAYMHAIPLASFEDDIYLYFSYHNSNERLVLHFNDVNEKQQYTHDIPVIEDYFFSDGLNSLQRTVSQDELFYTKLNFDCTGFPAEFYYEFQGDEGSGWSEASMLKVNTESGRYYNTALMGEIKQNERPNAEVGWGYVIRNREAHKLTMRARVGAKYPDSDEIYWSDYKEISADIAKAGLQKIYSTDTINAFTNNVKPYFFSSEGYFIPYDASLSLKNCSDETILTDIRKLLQEKTGRGKVDFTALNMNLVGADGKNTEEIVSRRYSSWSEVSSKAFILPAIKDYDLNNIAVYRYENGKLLDAQMVTVFPDAETGENGFGFYPDSDGLSGTYVFMQKEYISLADWLAGKGSFYGRMYPDAGSFYSFEAHFFTADDKLETDECDSLIADSMAYSIYNNEKSYSYLSLGNTGGKRAKNIRYYDASSDSMKDAEVVETVTVNGENYPSVIKFLPDSASAYVPFTFELDGHEKSVNLGISYNTGMPMRKAPSFSKPEITVTNDAGKDISAFSNDGTANISISAAQKGQKLLYTLTKDDTVIAEKQEYTEPIKLKADSENAVAYEISAWVEKADPEDMSALADSETVMKKITFSRKGDFAESAATPVIGVQYKSGESLDDAVFKVVLTSETDGAAIYYTTDGSDPTEESSIYSEPFTVNGLTNGEATVIKAVAKKDQTNDSETAQKTVEFKTGWWDNLLPDSEYEIPVQMIHYSDASQLSMGNQAIDGNGILKVDADGNKTLTIPFKAINIGGLEGYVIGFWYFPDKNKWGVPGGRDYMLDYECEYTYNADGTIKTITIPVMDDEEYILCCLEASVDIMGKQETRLRPDYSAVIEDVTGQEQASAVVDTPVISTEISEDKSYVTVNISMPEGTGQDDAQIWYMISQDADTGWNENQAIKYDPAKPVRLTKDDFDKENNMTNIYAVARAGDTQSLVVSKKIIYDLTETASALSDGIYSVPVKAMKYGLEEASMMDSALDGDATVTVKDGRYTFDISFNGVVIQDVKGHLIDLWIYKGTELTADKRVAAKAISTFEDIDLSGKTNTFTKTFEFTRSAQDETIYVRVHVDAMEGFDQNARLIFDWSGARKISEKEPVEEKAKTSGSGTGSKGSGSGNAKTAACVQVGKTYTVDGQDYLVTKAASGSTVGTVTFTKAKNAKKITVPDTVKLADGKTYNVTAVGAKAFTAKKIRTVTVGANVTKLAKKAFAKSKAKKLILKTKSLKKASVKGSLKSSKVKKIQVKVGTKKVNKKFVKKYKKIFTKKNAGKKATVK